MAVKKRVLLELLLSFGLVLLAAWIFWQRDTILDNITVLRYEPTQEVAALADATGMNESGRWHFYVGEPSLEGRQSFNQHCSNHFEKSIVLGCYNAGRIYIYNVDDPRLPHVEEVTAAHEMLHAAYARLGSSERERVDALLDKAIDEQNNQHITSLVKLYKKNEPDYLHNEMHSILGTEAAHLPRELEQYYSQYFSDRGQAVQLAQQYQSVFNDLQKQQQRLSKQLADLAAQIDSRSNAYDIQVKAFEAKVDAFNQRARSGGFESQAEYDREYAALRNEQNELEAQRQAINDLIAAYNQKRQELQDLIIETKSLNQSIDSRTPSEVPEV